MNLFIKKNFVTISMGEEFLELSFEEATELLSADDLCIKGVEDDVFDAAMRWIELAPERTRLAARYDCTCSVSLSCRLTAFILPPHTKLVSLLFFFPLHFHVACLLKTPEDIGCSFTAFSHVFASICWTKGS